MQWVVLTFVLLGVFSRTANPKPSQGSEEEHPHHHRHNHEENQRNKIEPQPNPENEHADYESHEALDHTDPNKLLLILIDGFRWDYLHPTELTTFQILKKEGATAGYMNALFPSLSYPSYYSILTGRYAESHGMIGNMMYDPEMDDWFLMEPHPNTTHSHWWNYAEPVWVSAIKNGLKTRLYLWPGCTVVNNGVTATSCIPYQYVDGLNTFSKHLTMAVDGFEKNDTDFALVYCEWTDKMGHAHGPESEFIKAAVKDIDIVLGHLIRRLKTIDVGVNVVIVSDHGMTPSGPKDVIYLSIGESINMDNVRFLIDRGAVTSVYPVEGKLEEVYQDLNKMVGVHVYKKDEIPSYFHYKNNRLVAPIIVVAKRGYFIDATKSPKQIPFNGDSEPVWMGFHGYDPDDVLDMRAIFQAWGPDFKKNVQVPFVNITDPYLVMTAVLGIEPLPNNGTWKHVLDLLEEQLEEVDYNEVAGKPDRAKPRWGQKMGGGGKDGPPTDSSVSLHYSQSILFLLAVVLWWAV